MQASVTYQGFGQNHCSRSAGLVQYCQTFSTGASIRRSRGERVPGGVCLRLAPSWLAPLRNTKNTVWTCGCNGHTPCPRFASSRIERWVCRTACRPVFLRSSAIAAGDTACPSPPNLARAKLRAVQGRGDAGRSPASRAPESFSSTRRTREGECCSRAPSCTLMTMLCRSLASGKLYAPVPPGSMSRDKACKSQRKAYLPTLRPSSGTL